MEALFVCLFVCLVSMMCKYSSVHLLVHGTAIFHFFMCLSVYEYIQQYSSTLHKNVQICTKYLVTAGDMTQDTAGPPEPIFSSYPEQI